MPPRVRVRPVCVGAERAGTRPFVWLVSGAVYRAAVRGRGGRSASVESVVCVRAAIRRAELIIRVC